MATKRSARLKLVVTDTVAPDLAQQGREIKAEIEALEDAYKGIAIRAIAVGERLLRTKAQLEEHGQWGFFLKASGIKQRTANRYMDYAKAKNRTRIEEQISHSVADLTIRALDQLIAPPASDCWGTPPEFRDDIRAVLGPDFLDVCSSAAFNEIVGAGDYFDEDADGLDPEKRWGEYIYMNMPFSNPGPWTRMALTQIDAGHSKVLLTLAPNKRGTDWFDEFLARAAAACWVKRRIRFMNEDGTRAKSSGRCGQVFFLHGPEAPVNVFQERFDRWATNRKVEIFTPTPAQEVPQVTGPIRPKLELGSDGQLREVSDIYLARLMARGSLEAGRRGWTIDVGIDHNVVEIHEGTITPRKKLG